MSIPQQKEKSSVGTRKKGSSSPPLTNICLYRTGYMFRKIAFFSVSAFSGFERCSVIPALRLRSTSSENAFAVIAMIGTTIAPWMMFYSQSNVVEKGVDMDEYPLQKVDVVAGTIAACLVAWFIIVTTGTVLYPQGIEISSAADAASALAPFAGPYAEALFAIGLIAASFLAACVLPLTTAFVICEAFGWEAGVSFKWREAPLFKSIFTFIIVLAAAIVEAGYEVK